MKKILLLCSLVSTVEAAVQGTAFEPIVDVVDPSGDVPPKGLRLPTLPQLSADGLDLQRFVAFEREGKLNFWVQFGNLQNPWNAPSGWSSPVIDIFIQTKKHGVGRNELTDLGLYTKGGLWQEHVRATPWQTEITSADGERRLLSAAAVQSKMGLWIRTDLPAKQYAYWVSVSVHSPFSRSGVLQPQAASDSPWPFALLYSLDEGLPPAAVDVLAPEGAELKNQQLPAVGEVSDGRIWWLWGLLGLGIALLLGGAWRLAMS